MLGSKKYTTMKNRIIIAMIGVLTLFSGCKEEFAEVNTDPSVITAANVPYLFAQGVLEFQPVDYPFWFYNGRYMSQLAQAYVPLGGYTDEYNRIITEMGGQGAQVINVLKYAREIDEAIKSLGEEGQQFAQIRAMLNPLLVFLGLFDSDMYGSRPFSEAAMARFGGTLTPKYDTVEEQYEMFLQMLDESLETFANPPGSQTIPSNQDPVYKGDVSKWAKLTNSLKLKIAVRLLHRDKARALKIAEEVVAHEAGILTPADDFLFCKGIQEYGTGESITTRAGAISKPVADFMLANLDPRIRFMGTKNGFNSKIVQAFFDQEAQGGTFAQLPAYILANVEYEVENGKKIFRSWKSPGEPWIRYYGLPTEMDASLEASVYGDYFDDARWKIGPSGGEKSYAPYSSWPEEMARGRVDYTIPTVPGGPVIEDKEDHPLYAMYYTAAEVNLYLAELKLLGANLPGTAQEYLTAGIEASVRVYDHVAALNKIPYYGTTYGYDEHEKVIDLQEGEVETLLASPVCQLTGSIAEQLEKVYIQQYLHFMFNPDDQYVSVRRSGIPKAGSTLLAWNPIVSSDLIPRRMEIITPSPTSLTYQVEMDAYAAQGFTPGGGVGNPAILNAERLWQDVGTPNFGEGPNF
jgi:hypothetical protein